MSGVFVSYAHVDKVPAEQLAEALRAAGYPVFLDVDPDHGIPAGTLWADELHRNVERADIVVFLASEASLGSPWCHTELTVAIARRRHVVQVSLSEVDVHPVLGERQALPAAPSMSELVRRLLADLERAGFKPSDRGVWDPNRSPFPGLDRLTADYAPVFFGREREVDAILGRLLGPRPAPILVVGASGSGKSSLLQAGVLARLAGREGLIVLSPVYPGPNPLGRFVHALTDVDPTLDADRISADPRGIADAIDRLTVHGERVIACIDQAEDLLTVGDPDRTTDLLRQLAEVDPDRLSLLVALRSASMDAWGRDPRFAALSPADPVWVRPLDRAGLRQVIVGPAREADISFEPPELVDAILDDTGDGIALPLLAALLDDLTRGHTRTQPVTVDQRRYETLGPVASVIERRAKIAAADARSKLGMTNEQVIQAFLRLVELDDDGHVVRTELEVDPLPPQVRGVCDAFERNRLVVRDRRVTASDDKVSSEPVEVVTAVHEVVFTAWPELAEAVEAQRKDLDVRSRLRREAQQWSRGGGGAVSLTGGRLDQAVDWRKRHPDDLSPEMRRYLDAAAHQRRRRRRLTVATPILATVVVVVTVFAVLLFRQVGVATDARRTTDALRLVAESESAERTRPDLSLLLALEAAARGGDPRAVNAPFVALTRGAGPRRYQQIPARVVGGAFGADGTRAIVTDTKGDTIDWDAAAGQQVLRTEALATATAISADGSTVAVADANSVGVRPFGAEASRPRCPISGDVKHLRLTQTGKVLVTVVADRAAQPTTTVLVGGASSCAITRRHHVAGRIVDAAIDDVGGRLAVLTGSEHESRVQIISLETGRVLREIFAADTAEMTSVAIAKDEVATLDTQGILRVWRIAEATAPWQARALAADVAGAALAPLPRPPQADNSSALRWLAAGMDGGLTVLATGDDRPAVQLASLPPLGDLTPPRARALGAGHGTANVVDQTGRITTWSFDTSTAFDSQVLAGQRIDHVAALSDGTLIATGPKGAWILNDQNEVRQLPAGATRGILIARDQTWALASSSGEVLLGQGPDAKVLGSVKTAPVAIAFLDTEAVAVVDGNGRATVLGGGEPRTLTMGEQLGSPVVAGTAGAGHLYLALENGQLAVVDTADSDTASAVRLYPAHGDGPASAVAISADGKLLATGGDDRRVVLWDLRDGVPQARPALIGHNEQIAGLAFSANGNELGSSAEDGAVIRWNVGLGERIGEPVDLPSIPHLAYASGDLVVGSSGVSRWPLDPARWLEVSCQLLGGRTFSEAERRQILGAKTPTVHCPSR